MLSRTADHLFWMCVAFNTTRRARAACAVFSALFDEGSRMLSRTADHLFWMSRYTERAEKPGGGRLSTQHRVHAQRVRCFLPCSMKEAAC